jgi:type I protein arginine methyltransferase
MHSIHGYGSMILDRGRTAAYAAALRARIRPGSVVMDIGTGTGIMAFLACQFGARKVYAIEPDGVIQLAREAAAANGFANRIEFIPKLSTELELAEQVDGIVADLRGVVPPFQQGLSSMVDARNRFLPCPGWLDDPPARHIVGSTGRNAGSA